MFCLGINILRRIEPHFALKFVCSISYVDSVYNTVYTRAVDTVYVYTVYSLSLLRFSRKCSM